ncbi:YDG domain-containing protein [Aquabacterium soli]|nr:YDG domain-containing protein [Aquabacterium soli]
MNHVYRLIWREAAGGFVAVAEMARACGARTASKAVAVSSALLCVLGAHAAGTGFNPVEGSATLATSGATTTVNQTTNGVRIEWQTLGVAAGETLKFVQPSANAVALNVIKGGVATEILGQLQANGNVFILNPNGVLVGAGAQVTVGGFMASTDDLVSFNAANGGVVLQANGSTAEVRNAGTIVATQGGMVALVGNKVINTGTIVAPGGGIYLLGGGRAEFKPGDGSPFTYSLTTDSAHGKSLVNSGTLRAAGGQIAMDARSSKQAVVNAQGVIEAGGVSAGPDGAIRLTALGGVGQITVQQRKGNMSAGTNGTITAQLDAGGTFTKIVGDPNSAATPVQDRDGWLSAEDKTYDGTTAATAVVDLKQITANYLVFKLASADFVSRNAGTGVDVTVTGSILAQSFGANFLVPATLQATIHKASLTITSADVTKTYDGLLGANGTALVGAGTSLKGTDSLSGGSFAYSDKNAGTGKTVTVAGVTVNDGNNGNNYDVTYIDNTTSVIDKASLTITSADVTKTYDGQVSADGTAVAGTGTSLKGTDSLSGGSFAYTDKNAGTGKTVKVAGVTVNDGNNGNNYDVTYVDNTTSVIDKASLTITSADVTKTYNGLLDANGTAQVGAGTSLKGTDSISGGTFAYTDKNAGTGKTVTVAGVTVNDGNNGNNYDVTYVDNTTSVIDKASLTITSADVTKTYNGLLDANGTAQVGAGTSLKGTDSISGGTFAYTDKNAGTGKTVTVAGVTVNDGNNGNNYDVTYVDNTTSAIGKASLTITSADVTKTYNGLLDANGTAQVGAGTSLKGADSISGGSFAYTDKNAGTGKTVTVAGVTVNDGNNGNNYDVTYVDNTTSVIDKASLTITSADVTKTYNGLLDANGTAQVGAGTSLKGTDSISGGSFAYTDKNAGTGKTVTVAGVTVNDGNNGNNYDVTYAANTTSTINRAGLTLSAVTDSKAFDTTATSTAAPQASGLVANESIAALSQSFDSSAVGVRGINVNGGYAITDANGASSLNNYDVTLVSATGAITSPPPNPPTTTPDLGTIINNGGGQPTSINVDLAGLGDLLAQLPPTAAGEEDDPEKIKARRRSDRSPLRVTDGGVKSPQPLR